MKFRSCGTQRIACDDEKYVSRIWDAEDGTFCWRQVREPDGREFRCILIKMPYDTGVERHTSLHVLRVKGPGDPEPPSPYWDWDGNEDQPTLAPSIGCGMPRNSDWHGYLKAGRLEACE